MDSHKSVWIEAGFQASDGLLLQMLFAFAGQSDVVVLGFRVVELCNRNECDAGSIAHYDAFEELFWRACCCGQVRRWRHFFSQARFGSFESGFESFAADRLKEIVDGV